MLLQQVVDDWENILCEEFSVQIDWSGCASFSGFFDIQEVFRVFDNLLSNIKKYADKESPVDLRISVEKGYLTLDQTNGIIQNCVETDSHQLGLATIRHIVLQYGGTVEWGCSEGEFHIAIRIPVNA